MKNNKLNKVLNDMSDIAQMLGTTVVVSDKKEKWVFFKYMQVDSFHRLNQLKFLGDKIRSFSAPSEMFTK